jgi:hypothetical protein
MSRLFTFGCSFTQYWRWPTWADILGRNFDFYENWGVCGAGNSLIFYSLIEAYQKHQFTKDDSVYIMWSSTAREDRYVKDKWVALGNIFWDNGSELPNEYIKKFACERGYLLRDLALITAALGLLDSIGCDYKFLSMVPLTETNYNVNLGGNFHQPAQENLDIIRLYRSTLDNILPSVYEVVFNNNWSSRPGIPDSYNSSVRDFHPTPSEHLAYLQTVLPNINIDHNTVEWTNLVEQQAMLGKLHWHSPNIPNRL